MPPLCANAYRKCRNGCALHGSTGSPGEAQRRWATPAWPVLFVATERNTGSAAALLVEHSPCSPAPSAVATPHPSAWIRESWANATKLSSPRTSRSDRRSHATQPSSRHISDRPPSLISDVLAHAARDVDRGTRQVAGPVAGQEGHQPGDLRDVAE